jgi:hypothetical protein
MRTTVEPQGEVQSKERACLALSCSCVCVCERSRDRERERVDEERCSNENSLMIIFTALIPAIRHRCPAFV